MPLSSNEAETSLAFELKISGFFMERPYGRRFIQE